MVVDRHPHELSGFDELPRDPDVLAARLWISRRMVVRYNDSSRISWTTSTDTRLYHEGGLVSDATMTEGAVVSTGGGALRWAGSVSPSLGRST